MKILPLQGPYLERDAVEAGGVYYCTKLYHQYIHMECNGFQGHASESDSARLTQATCFDVVPPAPGLSSGHLSVHDWVTSCEAKVSDLCESGSSPRSVKLQL